MNTCEKKRKAIRDYINGIVDNDFYTVVFTKKTTGEVRVMNARQHVYKHSNGGVNPCSGKPDLLPTYDMKAAAYRTITLDNVIEIRHNGNIIKFDEV